MRKTILLFLSFLFLSQAKSQITSAADGAWTNPATWVGGVVPTASDVVIIAASHDITLNASGACRTLFIETGGTTSNNGSLTINVAGTSLTVGDFATGGGKDSVVIRGRLTISNGELNIGGRLHQFASPAQYTQTAGIVRIDGNTGSDATSVADDYYLFQSGRNYVSGFSFSGGTLLFIDPPRGASGKLLLFGTGNMYLGTNSHVQFGDGISTTAGGSPLGFTFTAPGLYVAGDVTINNPGGTNRMVTNSGCIQMQALNLVAGTLNNTVNPDLLAASVNNGTINQTGTLDCVGGLINNGTVSATSTFLAVGDLTNNTGASITAPNMYLTGNVTNNGTMSASSTFAFARSNTTNGTTAQTISGTGIFNTSTALLRLDNSHAGGVTLNRSLTVNRIHLSEGKLFLGNNDLTFLALPVVGGGAGAYIVSNGTGRLRLTNLTTTEALFPVGTSTSYNPVRINNGSGHTFSVGVQEGFTIPPAGTEHVLQEWDIDDETGGAVSATVTLQWNATDEDPTFNRNACAISHYTGGSWKKEGTVGPASGTNPYTKSATGVTSFSPFTVSSNAITLPLMLTRFAANKEGRMVKLSWQTDAEEKVSHFDVEKSADGIRYSVLASINARNVGGQQQYEAVDYKPTQGVNFYRLKMHDKNGQVTYSAPANIEWKEKALFTLWPNPTAHEIYLQGNSKPTALFISDVNGRRVLQLAPTDDNRYRLQSIKSGTYFLHVQWADGNEVIPFVKQ